VEDFRRDVHRDVSGKLRRGAEQDRCLGARAASELDQRGLVRQPPGHVGRVLAENAELGASRIIFRQLADALEQPRAGAVVEILCRQRLALRLQSGKDVGGESGGGL
jgi:hypothetical protein